MTFKRLLSLRQRRFSILSLTLRLLALLSLSIAAILIYFHAKEIDSVRNTPLKIATPRLTTATTTTTTTTTNTTTTTTTTTTASRPLIDEQSVCHAPQLKEDVPEMAMFTNQNTAYACKGELNWVTVRGGMFLVEEQAARQNPGLNCTMQSLDRKNDFKTGMGETERPLENGTRMDQDFYWVNCSAPNGATYSNYHSGTSPKGSQYKTACQGLDLDVVMLGVDSVSRMMWHRKLKKTRDYFLNVLNGTELQSYNIVGDGTPAALLPILTGLREEELPEARRGNSNATVVDGFPWVWKNFSHAGYVTAWAEEQPEMGTFQYRLLGFNEQPVDHYYRPFTIAFKDDKLARSCLGSKLKSTALLEYIGDVFYAYPKNRKKWLLGFLSELSHGRLDGLTQVDIELSDYIQKLHKEGHLDQALLIMFADHGARFQKLRALEQGKLEERLPYFGLRFPKWFHEKYPDIIQNLKINSKRLTTPFDIHETLLEVLRYTGSGPADISKRGVSLFKSIPARRHCHDADVDPHWCACLSWEPLALNTSLAERLQLELTATLNNITESFRDLCSVLLVTQIISMSIMQVQSDVLKFIQTNDGGRGRFGEMAKSVNHTRAFYQVVFDTEPGGGKFEVTVTHNLVSDAILLETKDISRINKYGDAPHCVQSFKPFLRPYCYCKDLLGTTITGNGQIKT